MLLHQWRWRFVNAFLHISAPQSFHKFKQIQANPICQQGSCEALQNCSMQRTPNCESIWLSPTRGFALPAASGTHRHCRCPVAFGRLHFLTLVRMRSATDANIYAFQGIEQESLLRLDLGCNVQDLFSAVFLYILRTAVFEVLEYHHI